jgi:site-specific DNA-methyltransferase (adenine-specific)
MLDGRNGNGNGVQLLLGDCRELLNAMPDESVQCCVTSPPYWGLRCYNGGTKEIGQEKTPEEYVATMVRVFREVRRVLRNDGTLWLNLGDTYAASRSYQVPDSKHPACDEHHKGSHKIPPGYKQKDLVGIPWMVAFALRADGWYLRQDIIWAKNNPMPESVKDRCTRSHEYLFLCTKSAKYYFDSEAMQEPCVKGAAGSTFNKGKTAIHQLGRSSSKERVDTETRNRRSVWTVNTRPYKGAHFATYPPELIRPCILAGTKPGDIVLDPFGGSGTSGEVALELGRRAILCELNPDYLKLCGERTSKEKGRVK